jgi:hypothetical protein
MAVSRSEILRGHRRVKTAPPFNPARSFTEQSEIEAPRSKKLNGRAPVNFVPTFVTAEALGGKTFAPLEWIVQDILPIGLALLAGKSKIGKSWLALDLAVSVASGAMLFGEITTYQCPVLYLALEDGERRLADRMRKILGAEAEPAGLTFATEWRAADCGGLALLEAWLAANPACRLAIVDTLGKIRGKPDGARGAYQQDYDDMAALKHLADARKICLLLIHHTRKMAADDVFDLVSGTTGLVGVADTIMVLTKKRNEDIGELAITGRDIIDDGLFAMRFDKPSGRWKRLGRAEEVRANTDQQKIYDLLAATGDLMTPGEIAEGTGISRNTVKVSLTRMKREMRVENPERGKWRTFGSSKSSSDT